MNFSRAGRLSVAGLAVVIAASAAVARAYADESPASAGAAGIGDRLYPLLGNGGYDVQNYDLSLRYPEKDPQQTITGDVTITATATQDLTSFNLDFGGTAAGTVTVDGQPATLARDGDELVVTPASHLFKGRPFTVTVKGFTTAPKFTDSTGIIATPDGTVLAGQPNGAHVLFPSNDHPRDKATYTISLAAPTGWTGTANGVLTGTRTQDGYVTSTYRQSRPMASELVQVAVGDFLVHTREPVGDTVIRDVVPTRLASTPLPKLDVERSEIKWFEDRVGPYPFESYGALVIEYKLGFGLETQTLTLFESRDVNSPADQFAQFMAHEISHQWFGDSVTPASWSDVWLSEGHATWYQVLYAAENGVLKNRWKYEDVDAYAKDVYGDFDIFRAEYGPIAAPRDAAKKSHLFNQNVYDGAAVVLYALRQQIGDEKFQKLEREWVRVNRDKSVTTQDFIDLASQVSGQDLDKFLNDWLYGTTTPPMPGHPDWKLRPVEKAAQSSTNGVFDPHTHR